MPGLGSTISNAINTAVGQSGLSSVIPGVQTGSVAPNPANTTTAVNAGIVINGQLQGLLKSFRVEHNFNIKPQTAIGAAIRIALIPGVYEGSGSFEKSFLFGQTLESAAGNILLPVIQQNLANNDFTKSYFNTITLDNNGNPLNTYHDCMIATKTEVIAIEQVVITEDASVLYRWYE
jgi:hypothetical protein